MATGKFWKRLLDCQKNQIGFPEMMQGQCFFYLPKIWVKNISLYLNRRLKAHSDCQFGFAGYS
ncbi:MAG: hypothetical protein ACRYFB_06735 [Janthinobacterium lividum]